MSTRCPELASIRKVVDLYIDGVQSLGLIAILKISATIARYHIKNAL